MLNTDRFLYIYDHHTNRPRLLKTGRASELQIPCPTHPERM